MSDTDRGNTGDEQQLEAESFFSRFAGVVDDAANALADRDDEGADSLIGQPIGHYQIEARLGEGGMGVVYRAFDTRLSRTVALKFLPDHADRRAKERFLIEARAAAALDHPNICSIYEVGETETHRSFIAMAFYPGETLDEILKRGPLPWPKAVDYTTQIARGLGAAHERGIVHRDVKPSNVIVTENGVVKLLDFGIARMTDVTGVTASGVTPGTMAYMSPEQATGRPVDARTDLWSLGVLLYEMCIGRRPFRGKTTTALLNAIVNERPTVPSKARPELPRALGNIIARSLEKDPAARYADADALLTDLTRAQASAPATLPTRKIGMRTAVVLVTVLTVAALVWFFFLRRGPAVGLALAVLPLESLSPGPGQQNFAEALHDQLIMEIGTITSIRVIDRASVLQYRDNPLSLPQIATQLNVTHVLDGSAALDVDSLRINIRLHDHTGKRLWGHTYWEPATNALRLQGEIGQRVAREIRATITPDERNRLAGNPRVNPEALRALAEGFRLFEDGGPLRNADSVDSDSAQRLLGLASERFEEAIRNDSSWALPWAYLAETRSWQATSGEGISNWCWWGPASFCAAWWERADSLFQLATDAALHAIDLDSTEAIAWAALGYVRRRWKWDWEGSRQAFDTASRFSPNAADWGLAIFYETTGDLKASIAAYQRASERDPASQVLRIQYATALICDGRDEQGLKMLPIVSSTSLRNWATFARANGLLRAGRYNDAIHEFKRLVGSDENPPPTLAYAHWKAGDTARARKIVTQRKAQESLADNLVVGDTASLLANLEAMIDNKSLSPTIRCDPYFRDLIAVPRAREMIEKGMNLQFKEIDR